MIEILAVASTHDSKYGKRFANGWDYVFRCDIIFRWIGLVKLKQNAKNPFEMTHFKEKIREKTQLKRRK